MAASRRSLAAFAAMLVCVVLSGPSPILGQESPSPSALLQEPLLLEGIVLEGDLTLDGGTVVLHHVNTDTIVPGAVFDSATVGPGGEFQFLLPAVPDGNIRGDIYFASVDYEGVLYFGSAITTLDQLDSLYVVQVFQAEEVPPEGVPLPVEVRTMIVEFVGDEWIATDVFALANRGLRTLVAQEDGVVWSYPLPLGATEAELGEGDLPPDAVMFEEGRVVVSAPIPPGERVLMIRYRLEDLGSTIPAPGRTEVFELLVKEPAPPLQVVGLEPVDVVTLGPGSSYRRYGGTELMDLNLTIVETEERGLPPVEWLAVLTAVMLAAGGFLAYLRPRRSVAAGVDSELGREALILEMARVDNALAEEVEADTRSELIERRAALLTLLRNTD